MSPPRSPPDNASSNIRSKPNDPASSAAPTAKVVDLTWSLDERIETLRLPPRKPQPTSPVPFMHLLERLKTTKREGWRRFGITAGESISDHMYRMSILTMLAPASLSTRLDLAHCTEIALVHDMAESIVGDITPMDGVPKEEKMRREAETMDYLCSGEGLLGKWGQGLQGKKILDAFVEYEENKTLASQFVHDVDKLELLLQMVEYEREKKGSADLGEFSQTAKSIKLEEMKEWCREILRERVEFWKGLGEEPSLLDMTTE